VDRRRGEGVSVLLVGLALAAAPTSTPACDPAKSAATLEESGTREDYLCVSRADTGKDLLLAEIGKDPLGEHNRLTRALVLWLLERADGPMDPDDIARLSPGDRRLLGDGIRARRGRASPSPEHAAVFAQLPWYAPMQHYTDGRLRPVDRANLEIVDPAVRLAPPVTVLREDTQLPPAVGEKLGKKPPGMWGCAVGPVGTTGLFTSALLALLAVVRRRR
jgi:MYXO-CTERM domain-containing protein